MFNNIDNWNSGSTNYPSDWGDPAQVFDSVDRDIDNRRDFFGDKYVNTSGNGFIRRASMNGHNWYGILSTLTHNFNDNLSLVGGIDLRWYRGIHYRRVTNLLGADAYFTDTDINIAGQFISQEKEASAIVNMSNDMKLNYHNDGIVGWQGAFAQLEWANDNISAHISGAFSNQSYQRVDYFNYYYSDALSQAAGLEETMESETVNQLGGNIKGGINYNINSKHNVYFNGGFYSRQPLFDAVFLNFVNQINDEMVNEKVTGLELGYGFRSKFLNANLNLYRTTWTDRFRQESVQLGGGEEGTANLSGISQTHTGVEIELFGEIAKNLYLEVMFSLGDWTYSDNVNVDVYDEDRNLLGDTTLYLNNVKVGDAAQTTARVALTYTFLKNFRIYGSFYYADNLYADFDPTERAFLDVDNRGALKLPNFNLVDAGLYYDFKAGKKLNFTAKVNINNLFNTRYIAEAESNNFPEEGTDETIYTENFGYFGFGRTWNAGILMRW
jgi:hypothetical protein